MKRLLRPAFVVTSCIAATSCTSHTNPPEVEPTGTAQTPEAGGSDDATKGHTVHHRADGTCYIQVDKKEPPPPDLMSGERWVDNKDVPCPTDLSVPGNVPAPEGYGWSQDENGDCFLVAHFGNPPPPPKKEECPPSLKKTPK